jgi:hypothetical protein
MPAATVIPLPTPLDGMSTRDLESELLGLAGHMRLHSKTWDIYRLRRHLARYPSCLPDRRTSTSRRLQGNCPAVTLRAGNQPVA